MSTTTEGQRTADAVFLTPRIVDRDAFEELAGGLRALIERAAAERVALDAAADRAAAVLEGIEGETQRIESRLEAAAARAATIEQSVADLERAVVGAKHAACAAAEVELRVARSAADAVSRVEAETRLTVQLAQDRLRAVQDEAAARTAHLNRVIEERQEAAAARLERAATEVEERTRPARELVERSVGLLEERTEKLAGEIVRFTGPGLRALIAACDRAEGLLRAIEAAGDETQSESARTKKPRKRAAAAAKPPTA